VARHRRRGPGARAHFDRGGPPAAGQAQADLHAVIVNAAKVRLTGRKEEQKLYRYHSGYEGGVREERAKEVRAKQPTRIVEEAVRGMLPKTKMGEAMWRKLKVYAGPEHPHAAQKPKASTTGAGAAKKVTSKSEVA